MVHDIQTLPMGDDGLQAVKEQNENVTNLRENPLLTKAQNDLKEQLLERKRELEERIREKGFALKNATKKREATGVKMFGLQKTLGTLQTSLKAATESLTTIHKEHLKADEELCHYQMEHKAKSADFIALQEKMERTKADLNGLGEALKHIESHNEKIKSDIAVTRRVTYATEEDIVKAEKEKKDQDFDIAHLQHEIKCHSDRKELISAKIRAQKRETRAARDALSEAEIEMESIISEKKQIMAQWRSSLVVLARCDEAVQDTVIKAIMGPMAMTAALKKELDRLKLKLENLGCLRDRMISSLETRVSNRRQIFVKVQAVSQKKASDGRDAEEALHIKLVADLRKQIRDASRRANALTEKVEYLQEQRESLSMEAGNFSQSITKMTNQQEQLRLRLREVSVRKTSHLLATALQQRMVRRHCDFKASKWKVKIKVGLEEDHSEALKQCVTLYGLVHALMRGAPQLQPKLDTISVQLDLAIKF